MTKPFLQGLLPIVAGLSSVKRYSMVTMSRDESVLEHLGMVALTVMIICDKIGMANVDVYSAIRKALTHDLEEVIWGDVARPTKHHSAASKELFKSMSEFALTKVDKILGTVVSVDARTSKLGRTGAIVALADMLAVVYKVWDEVLVRGNMSMVRQADKIRSQLLEHLHKIGELFDEDEFVFLSELVYDAVRIANEAVAADRGFNYHIEEEFSNED